MRTLGIKLLRELLGMKTQALAIAAVVACAVATFVASLGALAAIREARDDAYARYHLADVFARCKRAPRTLLPRIAEIPGVGQVEARVVAEVVIDVPTMKEPATGRLVSIPEYPRPMLDGLHLSHGRWIDAERVDEAIASEAFAVAHRLVPGAKLDAIVNGRRRALRVVGIATAPEYVFAFGGGDIFPDDRRFGVLWMGERALASTLDMEGAFDDVALTLMPGANEAEVLRKLDAMLAPYGGVGAHGRDKLISHRYLSEELVQLRAQGTWVPALFLAVAAFLLNVVVSRLVQMQRTTIATLRAFGFGKGRIATHYGAFALVIVTLGAALGVGLGTWLGRGLVDMYRPWYRFPTLAFRLPTDTVLVAVGISLAAALLGAVFAVRQAAELPPAEAMRPEAPTRFGRTLLERLGLLRLFSVEGRMTLRNLFRRPVRSALALAGLCFAVAIVVVGQFTEDAMAHLLHLQYDDVQRNDAVVAFARPATPDALRSLPAAEGVVLASEPTRAIPVRLHGGQYAREVTLEGLVAHPALRRVVDLGGRAHDPPEGAVLLTLWLRDALHLRAGDPVDVELLDLPRKTVRLRVAGFVDEMVGINAYVELGTLRRILGEERSISTVALALDPRGESALHQALKRTPGIGGVLLREASLASFKKALDQSLGVMRAMQAIFAVVIAFAVVYNTARTAFAERSRELASLRVLGMTRGEVSRILLGELFTLTVVALPLGCVVGKYFTDQIATKFANDLYRLQADVSDRSYLVACVVVSVAALLSSLLVRRRVDRLDLVSVLKARD